ncbi:hypothetical protein [Fodinibius sp. AD559]|uniref:hypothetical protein n=1 Tax=Fodinibius sp. AD559 TaxID=3424179 RepID=UPI004046B29D
MSQDYYQVREEIEDVSSFISSNDYDFPFLKEESPDFLIIHDSKLVGIEHQRLFQPPDSDGVLIQNQESLKDQIYLKAKEFYDRLDGPNMLAFVDIKDVYGKSIDKEQYKLSSKDVDEIAEQVAHIVYQKNDLSKKKIVLNGTSLKNIDDRVDGISIYNNELYQRSYFDRAKGGLIPTIENSYLQKQISKKESKIEAYYEKCEEVWLLLVVNALTFERAFDLSDSNDFLMENYESSFDSIFIFTADTRSTYKLK